MLSFLFIHSSKILMSTFYVLGLYQILGTQKIDTMSPLLKLTIEREKDDKLITKG